MKTSKILTLTAAAALTCAAFVQNSSAASGSQGSGPSPYTECGIGAAIFTDTQWAAAVSNVLFDLGSTAITSALSSPEMCNPKKVKTAKLILETLPELEKDVAEGKGKYLDALMQTAGCKASDQAAVTSQLRSAYGVALSDADYASKSRIDRATVFYGSTKDAMAASSCNVVL